VNGRLGGWAVFLVLVTLISAGSAFALNLALGRFVVPDEVPERPTVAVAREEGGKPARSQQLTIDQYLEGIMRRNLFDSTVIATWNPAPAGAPGEGVVKSELHVKLLGTIVAQPDTLSSALIADADTKDLPKAYNLGHLLYDRTVVSIQRDRVGLQKGDGTVEYLTMSDGLLAAVGGDEAAPDGEGVTQSGENKFTVDKDLFDKNINDFESLSKMGRALLHRGPDGEYDGYRLSAIRKGSLPDQLGIKNGDIIQSVNGQPLNSMQGAMEAYNSMKTQQNFCFTVSRRGSPSELCYDVR
jgi:general secretion pathway protein C